MYGHGHNFVDHYDISVIFIDDNWYVVVEHIQTNVLFLLFYSLDSLASFKDQFYSF